MISLESIALEFDPEICISDEKTGSTNLTGSLHGWKEFATAWVMQIFDMGPSIISRSNDMNPKFIISMINISDHLVIKHVIEQNLFIRTRNELELSPI